MIDLIRQGIQGNIELHTQLMQDLELHRILESMIQICAKAFEQGNKILLCGNGGSAADAQHIAAELSGRYIKNRMALPAESLTVNSSAITAIANDFGFDQVFARQVAGFGNEGDILIGLSTSGTSKNVINAMHAATAKDMKVIGFCGEYSDEMEKACNMVLSIPSANTARIQECHILFGHLLCEGIEMTLFP